MELIRFALRHKALLLFGLLLTLFSSFGQTFFISLFVPDFRDTFDISNAYFGTLYSVATLLSAALLPWIGQKIDHVPLRTYTLWIVMGMLAGALILSVSQAIWMFFIGLFAVRFTGQGLMSHTSQTSMARYFGTNRGKALSISSLGFSLGEGILPLTVTLMIGWLGWRMSWSVIGVVTVMVLVPLTWLLLRRLSVYQDPGSGDPQSAGPESGGADNGDDGDGGDEARKNEGQVDESHDYTRGQMMRDARFYFVVFPALATPFLLTALFLYQTSLADFKGWDIELLASAFTGFAVAKVVFSLAGGALIDRFTARRLFPFFLLPLGAGICLLTVHDGWWIAFAYMIGAGMTQGMGYNLNTALFAELYGVRELGAIRSLMAMLMVFSTSVAPALMGFLLDAGVGFPVILYSAAAFVLICCLLALRVFRS